MARSHRGQIRCCAVRCVLCVLCVVCCVVCCAVCCVLCVRCCVVYVCVCLCCAVCCVLCTCVRVRVCVCVCVDVREGRWEGGFTVMDFFLSFRVLASKTTAWVAASDPDFPRVSKALICFAAGR